jgi:hypothetical protein
MSMSHRHRFAPALVLAAALLTAAPGAVIAFGRSGKSPQAATTPQAAASPQKSNQIAAYQRPTDPFLYVGEKACRACVSIGCHHTLHDIAKLCEQKLWKGPADANPSNH